MLWHKYNIQNKTFPLHHKKIKNLTKSSFLHSFKTNTRLPIYNVSIVEVTIYLRYSFELFQLWPEIMPIFAPSKIDLGAWK